MKNILFCDLDDTVLVSKRRFELENPTKPTQKQKIVDEFSHKKETVVITQSQQQLLNIFDNGNIYTVTARNWETYQNTILNIPLLAQKLNQNYITLDFGANIVNIDGKINQAYRCHQRKYGAIEHYFQKTVQILKECGVDAETVIDFDYPCYLKFKNYIDDEMEQQIRHSLPNFWKVFENKRNYWIFIPIFNTKEFAVQYLIETQKFRNLESNRAAIFAAGNADSDKEFMKLADFAITPTIFNAQILSRKV